MAEIPRKWLTPLAEWQQIAYEENEAWSARMEAMAGKRPAPGLRGRGQWLGAGVRRCKRHGQFSRALTTEQRLDSDLPRLAMIRIMLRSLAATP